MTVDDWTESKRSTDNMACWPKFDRIAEPDFAPSICYRKNATGAQPDHEPIQNALDHPDEWDGMGCKYIVSLCHNYIQIDTTGV